MGNVQLGTYYTLSLYAPTVLTPGFEHARLVGVLDFESAIKVENVFDLHRQVSPFLPDGSPRDYRRFTYYHFKIPGRDGKEVDRVIADIWIVPKSMKPTTGASYTVTLNNIDTDKLTTVRDQLLLLGIDFTID